MLGGIAGSRTPILLGAVALGWAHKSGWLAKIPLIGKAGPITSFGLIGWGAEKFLRVRLPDIVDKSVTAALAIGAFHVGATIGEEGGIKTVGEYPGGAVVFD